MWSLFFFSFMGVAAFNLMVNMRARGFPEERAREIHAITGTIASIWTCCFLAWLLYWFWFG